MENSSKAIIIAGTVIIVMMFIAAGMYYFTKLGILSGSVKKKYSDDEINTFNNQFMSYELNQKGSRVKELITVVNNSNKNNDSRVEINYDDGVVVKDDAGVYYPGYKLINSANYNIEFEHDSNNFIIKAINIKISN